MKSHCCMQIAHNIFVFTEKTFRWCQCVLQKACTEQQGRHNGWHYDINASHMLHCTDMCILVRMAAWASWWNTITTTVSLLCVVVFVLLLLMCILLWQHEPFPLRPAQLFGGSCQGRASACVPALQPACAQQTWGSSRCCRQQPHRPRMSVRSRPRQAEG